MRRGNGKMITVLRGGVCLPGQRKKLPVLGTIKLFRWKWLFWSFRYRQSVMWWQCWVPHGLTENLDKRFCWVSKLCFGGHFFHDITLNPFLHHICNSGSPYGLRDKRFIKENGKGVSLPFEKSLWHLSNDVNWFIMVMVMMMMMKEKGVHAVWSWWLIDGHRNLSCLEDIQTWDQSCFLSRPSRNIFFLAAATLRLPSLVPQPTCSWKWHPDTCRLGNPTTHPLTRAW